MEKLKKGSLGSLQEKKKNNLILTIAAFAVVLLVFAAGLIIFRTKNNYLTMLAIVLVLPAAKIAVGYFILLPHKSCPVKLYEQLKQAAPKLTVLYDLIISNSKKPVGVQACVVTEKYICVYTCEKNTDSKFFEKSVTDFIKNERLNVSVSLYTDWETFLKRVSSIDVNYDDKKENNDKMGWNKDALLHMCI